ncbi:MAG: phosphatidylserine decarboxylase [Psychrosphaera sp.]|nr:phosphatidylserine decarboxylase [Psychrosphaera sp.]
MKMPHKILAVACLIGMSFISTFTQAKPQAYSDHVNALKQLYHTDKALKKNIDLMLQNLDKDNELSIAWKGKKAQDLFDFFQRWETFVPTEKNGLDYIMDIVSLTRSSDYGLNFVRQEPGHSWLKTFAQNRGKFMDSKASLAYIDDWINSRKIKIDSYQIPHGGYRSFNDFFTRKLKPGARPVSGINDDGVIVSPADCAIRVMNHSLTLTDQIKTKGHESHNVTELLDGSPYAKLFEGGKAVRCDLLPHNYHHFHSPVTGTLVSSKENVEGLYFGDFGDDIIEFHRGYYIFKTEKYGYVAMIPVGMATISSVVFEDKFINITAHIPVEVFKGDRIGRFEYGGSLVIMLFEKDKTGNVEVQQGQQIGLFKPETAI